MGMMRVLAVVMLLAASTARAQVAPECLAPAPPAGEPVPKMERLPIVLALALGSGSSHGLAHIGVIQALEARGVHVDIVAGTSVGAIVGGLWASGYSGSQIEALSEGSDWEDVGAFSFSLQGLFTNRRLRDQMERLFGNRPIERWPRRFAAVATDLATGTRRVLQRGDGALAVQASTAIPVVFAPVSVGEERLGDGALVEPVPALTARGLGADFVLAVDVAYRPHEEQASGITGLGFQAMHILVNSLAAEQARHADHFLRLDLHHRLMRCGPRALIAAGRDALHAAWPAIERSMRAGAGLPARVHSRP